MRCRTVSDLPTAAGRGEICKVATGWNPTVWRQPFSHDDSWLVYQDTQGKSRAVKLDGSCDRHLSDDDAYASNVGAWAFAFEDGDVIRVDLTSGSRTPITSAQGVQWSAPGAGDQMLGFDQRAGCGAPPCLQVLDPITRSVQPLALTGLSDSRQPHRLVASDVSGEGLINFEAAGSPDNYLLTWDASGNATARPCPAYTHPFIAGGYVYGFLRQALYRSNCNGGGDGSKLAQTGTSFDHVSVAGDHALLSGSASVASVAIVGSGSPQTVSALCSSGDLPYGQPMGRRSRDGSLVAVNSDECQSGNAGLWVGPAS